MSRLGLRLLASLFLLGAAVSPVTAQPATSVSQDTVHEVAAQLRCVVCQTLSVADSPSEMASQMRAIIRDRLAAGERPAEVRQYFVDRYGEWILLSPPGRGFNLLVWLAPLAAVGVGLVTVAVLVRRWTRHLRDHRPTRVDVDPAMSERIRREVDSGP
jgi:cytochrome c-type biogenesis protein CcmH